MKSGIQFAMPEDTEIGVADRLARLERDVASLKNALIQMGAKPCCCCGKFYLDSSGRLFASDGVSVCYACLPSWWDECCRGLAVPEREAVEYKLTYWLIANHNAKVFRELKELPPKEVQEVHLVVACRECKGTGTMDRRPCRHCIGNGTVWVITPKRRMWT